MRTKGPLMRILRNSKFSKILSINFLTKNLRIRYKIKRKFKNKVEIRILFRSGFLLFKV